MIFCSRTIASADACVANAMVAIAVSRINQDLSRIVSSSLFGSGQHFATDGGLRLDDLGAAWAECNHVTVTMSVLDVDKIPAAERGRLFGGEL
jgi:hypothetical protein